MSTENRYAEVPLSSIEIQEDFNPRDNIEIDPSLVASIAANGVTVPLEVRENGGPDSFVLISGHRRLIHAKEAGATRIPVIVKPIEAGSDTELIHALIENMHRQDLTPYQEAKGLKRLQEQGVTSRKALRERTGLTDAVIKARLELLELPEEVALMLSEGDIPFAYVDLLIPWAKQAPVMCTAIAGVLRAEEATATGVRWFNRYVDSAILDIQETDIEPPVFQWRPHTRWELADFNLGDELNELVQTVNETTKPHSLALMISSETLDQGRAAGAVIDVDAQHEMDKQVWITSEEWMIGAFTDALNRKEIRKEIDDMLAAKDTDATDTTPKSDLTKDTRDYEEREAELEEQRKVERASEREQFKIDKESALSHNEELSKQLFERVRVDKPDAKVVDALIALAVEANGLDWAMQGLRYLHPGWTRQEKTEAGNDRTVLVEGGDDARIRLAAFLEAPTVEGKLTKFVQLFTAAYVADEKAVAKSRRRGFIPSARNIPHGGTILAALYKQQVSKLTPTMKKRANAIFEEKRSANVTSPFDDREFRSQGEDLGVSDSDD